MLPRLGMSMHPPSISRGTVRQGGKEELRASFLKTYLLRVRTEKGERVLSQLLEDAGVAAEFVDNETSWLSAPMVRRILKGVRDLLGPEALRHRGDYVTHPEALGTMVRSLRSAERPIDLYRYLALNAREMTRIATWEFDDAVGTGGGTKTTAAKPESFDNTDMNAAQAKSAAMSTSSRDSGANANANANAKKSAKAKSAANDVQAARLTYRLRDDADDDGEKLVTDEEELLCAARIGELASYPKIWGLPEATVQHDECLARGGEACVYDVHWARAKPKGGPAISCAAAAVALGGSAGLAGGALAGCLAGLLGGGLGWGAGLLYDRSLDDKAARTFERNRISALERGLELRGETGVNSNATPGELSGTALGGKYRIGRKIGSGGIGVVYAAEHTTLGHEVAVKVLRGAAARDGSEIARLRREAYIQVHIEHPNIARVMDLDQMSDGSIYVVMERLNGKSLADKLSRDGLVAPGAAIPVFIDVCKALGAAHAKSVVHRDLKPGNVFLCDDGSSKVLDFGMSKLTTAEALTQAGYTLGTPEYMAPEQCIGGNVEARTDIYALGVLMYEALTGELPIIAQSRRELLDLHQRQIPKPMRERRPDLDLPEALDLVVMKCLRKRMNDRPKSAEEVEQMLAAIPREGLKMKYPEGTPRRAPVQNNRPVTGAGAGAKDRDAKDGTDPKKNDAGATTMPGLPSSIPPSSDPPPSA